MNIDLHNIGEIFHKETIYSPGREPFSGHDGIEKPPVFKLYPNSPKIKLPDYSQVSSLQIAEALKKRRSVRKYKNEPLSKKELSFLLWATAGIQRRERNIDFRTSPSAGASYPIETYLVINDVTGIEPGIYHYQPKTHELDELKRGEFGKMAAVAALNQKMCAEAPAVFIWTAIFKRSVWRYGRRAYRYIYMDAGIVSENFVLAAAGINLGACQIAAFFDDLSNELIGVDGEEESVVMMGTVGKGIMER